MPTPEPTPIGDTFIWAEVDISDFLYKVRDVALDARDSLQAAITDAQTVLDDHAVDRIVEELTAAKAVLARLTALGRDAEDAAQLVAASDILPNASAPIPERAGLIRPEPKNPLAQVGKRPQGDI